jgi:hypothetical protein
VHQIADAIFVVKQAATGNAVRDDESAFEKAAQEYRASATKPVLPEEARRFKVQAEAAVREKRFDDAADLYGEALDVAPWS